MPVSVTGETTWITCAKRMWEFALRGKVNGAPNLPIVKSGEYALSMNNAGTGTVNLIRANSSDAVEIPTAVTLTGGVTSVSATSWKHPYAGGVAPVATTTGTNVTPTADLVYFSEVFLPTNAGLTGISYLIGTVGGTDKVIVMLFNSEGALVANSAVAGVTVGTTATFQRVPFTAAYSAVGPAKYWIGVQVNGNTCRLRTHAAGDHNTGSAAQTFGTPVAITVTTTFTADLGPFAMLY